VDSLKNHALENMDFVMKSLLKILILFLIRLFFNELGVCIISTILGSLSIRKLYLNMLALSFGLLWLFWLELQKSPEDVQQDCCLNIIIH
jgi:hypothetical protein